MITYRKQRREPPPSNTCLRTLILKIRDVGRLKKRRRRAEWAMAPIPSAMRACSETGRGGERNVTFVTWATVGAGRTYRYINKSPGQLVFGSPLDKILDDRHTRLDRLSIRHSASMDLLLALTRRIPLAISLFSSLVKNSPQVFKFRG